MNLLASDYNFLANLKNDVPFLSIQEKKTQTIVDFPLKDIYITDGRYLNYKKTEYKNIETNEDESEIVRIDFESDEKRLKLLIRNYFENFYAKGHDFYFDKKIFEPSSDIFIWYFVLSSSHCFIRFRVEKEEEKLVYLSLNFCNFNETNLIYNYLEKYTFIVNNGLVPILTHDILIKKEFYPFRL